MRQDRIVIQPYDSAWQGAFEEQRATLTGALKVWLVAPVEHIGSTSVPGLPAKPIVDMLALIDDHASFAPAFEPLEDIGWLPAPEPGDLERRRWSACFPSVEHRTHHLHVVEQRSEAWPDWLLFRDYLRVHPDAMRRYAELKQELAAGDDRDRTRYRNGKAPLIGTLLQEARSWRLGTP
ncbi:GrpB family protein [Promicromonospora sp. Marseille-Q5078]